MTDFAFSSRPAQQVRADAVVLFCSSGGKAPETLPASSLRKNLAAVMKLEGFSGKEGEILVWHAPGKAAARRYVVVGAGKKAEFDLDTLRRLFAVVTRKLGTRAGHLAVALPGPNTGTDLAARVQAAVEGTLLGTYHWRSYLTEARAPRLRKVTLLCRKDGAAIARGQAYAGAANLSRDLVCEPPSAMGPRAMVKRAREVARRSGLKIKIIDAKQAARLGMGCLLGVGRGSHDPPCLIHLTYTPAGAGRRPRRRVALVGKGITFDSGGLSLKPAVSMETMKSDMAGSAAVLGALSALHELQCPVEVHGILVMAENMPSATAYKPGDILRSLGGKTVEVLNTDAEGRLVLADGLEYATRLKPDAIIDVATLTGACVVALGTLCSGVMGYDREMVQKVLDAAGATGEKMWPLPFFREYRALLDSKVADIKHIGGRWGGAITAGMFLGEFVGEKIPWAHIDIAGPAFAEREQPLARVGGTGHPVRTLIRFVENSA